MNNLLRYNRKDTPMAIFDHPGVGTTERHLIDTFTGIVTAQTAVPDNLLHRIAYRPALLADLIHAQLISETDRYNVVSSPNIALNLVCYQPSLFPNWREMILACPETAEQLAYFIAWGKMPNGKENLVHLPVQTEDILERLTSDPRRRLDILAIHDKERAIAETNIMREQVNARKYESAGWAFQWLSLNPVRADSPLDEALISALRSSEDYSYLAMRLLRDRILPSSVWTPLERNIVSPRWAYHLLKDGLALGHRNRLEQLLLTDPGWLVEYLSDVKITVEERHKFYINCAEVAYDHPLLPDLHHWSHLVTLLKR